MESYIHSIGTANPVNKISQQESIEFIAENLDLNKEEKNNLHVLYRATGIDSRYSVLEDYKRKRGEFEFFPNKEDEGVFPAVGQRMVVYQKCAISLSIAAIEDCLNKLSGFDKSSISHLITVSCTGMYAPGLDIEIVERLGLKTSIRRTAINFMGCYGAFNALKIADSICKSEPNANVLVVCVELCSIHFQKNKDEDHILSSALFGDGAAAALISSNNFLTEKSLSIKSFYCDIISAGKSDMAWHISDFGFEMKLSSYVPDMIKGGIGKLTENLLKYLRLKLSDIDMYAIHPGGKRILQVIERELGMTRDDNKHAYEVLRNYGNMSSPTVLFVLKSIFSGLTAYDAEKNILSFAFGPGLTLESMLLQVQYK